MVELLILEANLIVFEYLSFEKLLLAKIVPSNDIANHLFYKQARRFDLYATWSQEEAIGKRIAEYGRRLDLGEQFMELVAQYTDFSDKSLAGSKHFSSSSCGQRIRF
jgi:hypothetical protein